MKNSEKMLALLEQCRDRRASLRTTTITDKALDTIHHERNRAKSTCYWLGFLRGLISSDGIQAEELEPLIIHTEEFLANFPDDDAEELLTEICNDWPSVTDEAEGVVENILEFREEEIDLKSGYNASNYFIGFVKGIACDNKISENEVTFALNYLNQHPTLLADPRVADIKRVMSASMLDGQISPDESEELCGWISRLAGDSFFDTGLSSASDIAATEEFEKEFDVTELVGATVVVTGAFSGPLTRQEFIASLKLSGITVGNSVTKKTDVVIVADEASKHWATPNAGTKLLAAHKLRGLFGRPRLVTEAVVVKSFSALGATNTKKP